MLDRIAGAANRHSKLVALLGFAWLAVSSAHSARFIELPDIPFVTDRMAMYAAAAWNGVWWGFLHPAIKRRQDALVNAGGERVLPED